MTVKSEFVIFLGKLLIREQCGALRLLPLRIHLENCGICQTDGIYYHCNVSLLLLYRTTLLFDTH